MRGLLLIIGILLVLLCSRAFASPYNGIDDMDQSGWTPLTHAAYAGDLHQVKLLVDLGADLEKPDKNKETPLMLASGHGGYFGTTSHDYLAIVKLLLLYQVNVNSKDVLGDTALIWAASYGDVQIVKVLLSHRAKTTIRDKGGKTALEIAKSKGNKAVVLVLSKYKH